MGRPRWLLFFAIMGATFLVFNPAILLPSTWHQMSAFAGEHRIVHDSYEFMGRLYHNQMTLWFNGVPWYFYFVFAGVKISPPVLAAFAVGLPLLFLKRTGDGRYFILFWILFWFLPFTVLGGKFTRYFTIALPVILITAALGIQLIAKFIGERLSSLFESERARGWARASFAALVITFPAAASANVSTHFPLYTNILGGGSERAGSFFPHDEFYDAGTRDAVARICQRAGAGATVASETPGLVSYYAQLDGRGDIKTVSLSDRDELEKLAANDF